MTKIQSYGTVISINNSDLKAMQNMSYADSRITSSIKIDSREDVDRVRKIIKRELAKMSEPEDKGDAVKKEEPSKKKDRFKFELEPLEGEFTVCKVQDPSAIDLSVPFTFVAKTDTELSLVCPTGKVPAETVAREDGWRALRVAGILEFSLIGVLEAITHDLAKRGVSCFAVSTYDTDYVLVKSEDFDRVFAEE